MRNLTKSSMAVFLMVILFGTIVAGSANATTFAKSVTSCVDVYADDLAADGSALFHYVSTDPAVIQHYAPGAWLYCPDETADGCGDKWYQKGQLLDSKHATIRIPAELLKVDQRGLNNGDSDGFWGPLPHPYVNVHIGKNLIYQVSTDPSGTGSENGKGGGMLTYIGDLTKEQAARYKAAPYKGGQACNGSAVSVVKQATVGGTGKVSTTTAVPKALVVGDKNETAYASNVKSPSGMAAAAVESSLSQYKAANVEAPVVAKASGNGKVKVTTNIKAKIRSQGVNNSSQGANLRGAKIKAKGDNLQIGCTNVYNITMQDMENGKVKRSTQTNECFNCHISFDPPKPAKK